MHLLEKIIRSIFCLLLLNSGLSSAGSSDDESERISHSPVASPQQTVAGLASEGEPSTHLVQTSQKKKKKKKKGKKTQQAPSLETGQENIAATSSRASSSTALVAFSQEASSSQVLTLYDFLGRLPNPAGPHPSSIPANVHLETWEETTLRKILILIWDLVLKKEVTSIQVSPGLLQAPITVRPRNFSPPRPHLSKALTLKAKERECLEILYDLADSYSHHHKLFLILKPLTRSIAIGLALKSGFLTGPRCEMWGADLHEAIRIFFINTADGVITPRVERNPYREDLLYSLLNHLKQVGPIEKYHSAYFEVLRTLPWFNCTLEGERRTFDEPLDRAAFIVEEGLRLKTTTSQAWAAITLLNNPSLPNPLTRHPFSLSEKTNFCAPFLFEGVLQKIDELVSIESLKKLSTLSTCYLYKGPTGRPIQYFLASHLWRRSSQPSHNQLVARALCLGSLRLDATLSETPTESLLLQALERFPSIPPLNLRDKATIYEMACLYEAGLKCKYMASGHLCEIEEEERLSLAETLFSRYSDGERDRVKIRFYLREPNYQPDLPPENKQVCARQLLLEGNQHFLYLRYVLEGLLSIDLEGNPITTWDERRRTAEACIPMIQYPAYQSYAWRVFYQYAIEHEIKELQVLSRPKTLEDYTNLLRWGTELLKCIDAAAGEFTQDDLALAVKTRQLLDQIRNDFGLPEEPEEPSLEVPAQGLTSKPPKKQIFHPKSIKRGQDPKHDLLEPQVAATSSSLPEREGFTEAQEKISTAEEAPGPSTSRLQEESKSSGNSTGEEHPSEESQHEAVTLDQMIEEFLPKNGYYPQSSNFMTAPLYKDPLNDPRFILTKRAQKELKSKRIRAETWILKSINHLLEDILRGGTDGYPEMLKGARSKSGTVRMSRRVTKKDRLVYSPTEEGGFIIEGFLDHYDD